MCNLAFFHSQRALAFCHMAFYKWWLLIIWHFNNLAVFWSGNFSNGYLTSGVLSYGEFETGDISEQPFGSRQKTDWRWRNKCHFNWVRTSKLEMISFPLIACDLWNRKIQASLLLRTSKKFNMLPIYL